jgi:hypothetical protein
VSLFGARAGGWLAGLQISLPLTQRREMRPGRLQIHGARRWSYEVHSEVGSRTNSARWAVPIAPITPWNLETAFLDEGRLSRGRVAAGLARRSFERVNPID